ncbi:hypothetical protein FACS1894199_02300 [Bacteroidia bacterium]|nr:hypothetical protein FACS1894199_02300 [Bacteroidia bacterium]
MKEDMKNKLLLLLFCCISITNVSAIVINPVQSIEILDARLERGVDNTINLVIQNLLDDSISINSQFFIDEYYKPCNVWIYSCKYSTEKDSVICKRGHPHAGIEPFVVGNNTSRMTDIPPRGQVIFGIPLESDHFDKSEIYLDVRIFCENSRIKQFVSKITNKIYFEWTMSKLKKYQIEERQKKLGKTKE